MVHPKPEITAVSSDSLRLTTANERTFLSWLRLSIVLTVVGVGQLYNCLLDIQR
jgi:uncharacterized membrane protein YidH (DUF202 family)